MICQVTKGVVKFVVKQLSGLSNLSRPVSTIRLDLCYIQKEVLDLLLLGQYCTCYCLVEFLLSPNDSLDSTNLTRECY